MKSQTIIVHLIRSGPFHWVGQVEINGNLASQGPVRAHGWQAQLDALGVIDMMKPPVKRWQTWVDYQEPGEDTP